MFINSLKTSGAGIAYEQIVWNQLKNTYNQQPTIAFHHYEMFFQNGVGKREIDILFIHQKLGVFVFEVKGLTIDQIVQIQGHTWHYQNFYDPVGSPTQQAADQLYMLCNHIDKEAILGQSFNKYAVVALPLITKAEWQSRGFDQQLNTTIPLFKDDLASPEKLIARMAEITANTRNRELDNRQWQKMKDYFQIAEPSTTVPVIKEPGEFSQLYIIQSTGEFESSKKKIENALKIGLKVYILSYVMLPLNEIQGAEEFSNQFQLNYYESIISSNKVGAGVYCNGRAVYPFLDTLQDHFPDFNVGQYKAIHYPANTHQMISAGAGTGKTHVMIDRILYLIMYKDVPLKDIIMITFTNASTNEMKERLENKFISLFNLTRNSKFLIYAEEVKDMQISTIHSFAKSILKNLAHEIGYGINIRLRGFKNEKQQIIHQLMNEFFQTESIDTFLESNIRYYELISTANELWEEMEKKGLSENEIASLDWGASEQKSSQIQRLFQYIFEHCEERINVIKQRENAITMGDLIRKLKEFTDDSSKLTQLYADCHIFVDEFQDSDDVQIELLASLQSFLNYKLFVVGDIKQSIYRFRGADYRSFKVLKRKTEPFEYEVTNLQHNYRSSKRLLSKMHLVFEKWGNRKWLNYDDKDRLIGFADSRSSGNEWKIVKHNKYNWKQNVKEALQDAVQDLKPKQKLAIIVRTNWHAKVMKEICDDLDIRTSENIDGTFFTSAAVRHFKALIEGLLYPNEPKFLINALETPYFGYTIPYHVFIEFGGKKEQIINFVNECIGDEFSQYVSQLRLYSPMTVIQSIIYDKQFFARLSTFLKKQNMQGDVLELNLLRYEKNLHHLMTLIERNFNGANLSLHTLNRWLSLQMNTNRSENEPILHDGKTKVEITTVHRSKGLEYDTVFIPITNKPYNSVKPEFYIQDSAEILGNEARKIGWKINQQLYNDGFFQLQQSESNEQQKEEVRLLYVAITRAEQKVIIAMPESPIPNSWSSLLNSADVLKGARL